MKTGEAHLWRNQPGEVASGLSGNAGGNIQAAALCNGMALMANSGWRLAKIVKARKRLIEPAKGLPRLK